MAEYTDKYSVKVEYDTDSFNRFKKAKEEFQKKDTADDKANAKIKSDNNKHLNDKELAELKNNLKQKYVNVQAALEKERIAVQKGKELEVKEAIAARKMMEHELKLFEQENRTSLAMQLTDYRTEKAKELIEFRKTNELMLKQRNAPQFGSQAFVSQLKSEQRKFAPGTSDYQNLGIMIKGFEADFKKAGIEIDAFGSKIRTGVTGALSQAASSMGPYIAGMIGMAGAQKLWQLSLDTKKFEVMRSHFQGTDADLEALRISSARTVSEESLVKLSNQATDLGISLKNQAILFSLAEDRADKYGGSVEENFLGLINSTEGATKVLKTLGIQKEVYEKVVNNLAKAEGDAIEKLDPEIQKRIRIEALIRVSNTTYQDAINKQQDAADMQEELSVGLGDLILKYGWTTTKGIFPFIGALEKSAASVVYAKNHISEIGGTLLETNSKVTKFLWGWTGMRTEVEKPIKPSMDISDLEDSANRVKDIMADIKATYEKYGYMMPRDAKEPEAMSGTKETKTNNSNSGSRKEAKEKEAEILNLIKLQEIELDKKSKQLKENVGDVGSERKLKAEILEIEKEIYRLRTGIVNDTPFKRNDPVEDLRGWQQRIAEFGTGRFRGTPSEGNNKQADEDTKSALQKQLDFENQRLSYVQQMWTASNSMLENFGLMKGDTAEMVKWINSIIQGIGAGKSFFDGLTGLLSFIPGGSLIAGAAGAGGGMGRLANLSNIGSGNKLSPSRMIRETGSAKMNTTIIIKNPVRFEKAFEVETINRSLRTLQVAG